MSIRGRLLTLAIGGVLPLLIVGLAVLWIVWNEKRNQLNETLEQQAELVGVVFDRWLDAQYQPLRTIASYPPDHLNDPSALKGNLQAAVIRRPHWIDLRVLDATGKVIAIEPAGAGDLPSGLGEKLLGEAKRGASDVETDWTRGEGHYLLAVEVPLEGGAVIARIEGAALKDALHGITLPERAVVTLLDQNNRIIYRSQTAESTLGLDLSGMNQLSALNDRNTTVVVTRSSVDGVERVYGLSRVGNTGYVVMVGVQSAILYASAWRQLMGYAFIGLIVVFGAVTAALLIARSIARPVRLLNFAAEEFGSGNFSARAPAEGRDEMSSLGRNFNAMAERLQKREERFAELDRLKSEFVSTVSHELRTPLTTIKALTRLLMREGLDETKRREYIETISVECDRQIDLVLNLLDLSRIEGGVLRVTHQRVDVQEVISSVVKSETRSAEKRSHDLRFDSNLEVPPVCADPKELRRVLSNVVENAIKYTPDRGRIVLSALQQNGQVAISVTDNGRGIPPEDMPILFDKFHRGRPAPHSDDGDVPLQVWGDEGYGLSALRREMQRRGEQISALAVERLRNIGISSQVVIMSGDPKFLISFAARSWPADLILIRANNRKYVRNRLLGSVAKSVVKRAPCSVEVVRARETAVTTETARDFRVLLATDGSEASVAASQAIAEVSWPEDTEVRVVSVVNPMVYSFEELGVTGDASTNYAHRAIGKAVQVLSDAPVRISAEVIAGSAARQIIARAKHWGADLIVLGTNERRGLSRLLFGSTSAAVANRAHCSVRVIREKDVSLTSNSLQERFNFSGTTESANELQASRKAA